MTGIFGVVCELWRKMLKNKNKMPPFSPANTTTSHTLKTLYVPVGCVLTETHRKYITGELFTEIYCFWLLHEYLVSLSLLSPLFLCSHLLLHRPTFPLSLLIEITPWPPRSTRHWQSQCSLMEISQSFLPCCWEVWSMQCWHFPAAVSAWHTVLHVAHGAPFWGHNERSVDKLGQMRLFLAKQLSSLPSFPPSLPPSLPLSVSLFLRYTQIHTQGSCTVMTANTFWPTHMHPATVIKESREGRI